MRYLLTGLVILIGVGAVYWLSESTDRIPLAGEFEPYLEVTPAEYQHSPTVTVMTAYGERRLVMPTVETTPLWKPSDTAWRACERQRPPTC